jgi:RimJ/RimL family protein N-acetyltransferase
MTREGLDAWLDRIDAQFAQNGWGFWAVEERGTSSLIGLCGLAHVHWDACFTPAVEIGWRLSTQWQGMGLAREAAQTVLNPRFR